MRQVNLLFSFCLAAGDGEEGGGGRRGGGDREQDGTKNLVITKTLTEKYHFVFFSPGILRSGLPPKCHRPQFGRGMLTVTRFCTKCTRFGDKINLFDHYLFRSVKSIRPIGCRWLKLRRRRPSGRGRCRRWRPRPRCCRW